ncbi:Putative NADPH--cytochrome P450 reductase [Aspergillus calidoustus]|uniref:NADPH--hemoprotein reductase n=1 Tax=Aspergillus calidoustus TaxID=454130 RepID=A0A0U4YWY9_ASPCI|nr:Putative NADPH--cytochrome P450 reductase [Aspergillus calidoustus]
MSLSTLTPPISISPSTLSFLTQHLQLHLQTQPSSPADYIALTFLSLLGATYLSRGILWDTPDPYRHLLYERPQLKYGNGANGTNNGSGVAGDNAHQATRNVARKLEETGASIVIFWGSQSGTAESLAHRLGREITARFKGEGQVLGHGQGALIADLSDYDPESVAEVSRLQSKLVIFVLSTYGEGDPADNTIEFWDWLNAVEKKAAKENQSEGKKLFDGLRYFAFGLGNSNYKFYNRVIDRVAEVLDNHGANALLPISRANDANGTTQEDFISWKEDLFTYFREELGFAQSEPVYQPAIFITQDANIEASSLHRGEPRHSPSPTAIPITGIRQLFEPSSDRHCLHIDLDISGTPDVVYKTGDHLGVWPSNPDEEVDLLLQMLGRAHEGDVPISISPVEGADVEDMSKKVPSPTTLLVLLRHYLEITALIPRDVLATLAPFAPTPEAKTLLTTLANSKDSYAEFTRRNHLTLARILAAASGGQPWRNLPLSYIVETLPPLQPRYYSISSSSVVSPRKISLTVLVHKTALPENATVSIPGLTSTYLLSLSDLPSPSSSSEGKAILQSTYTNTLLLPIAPSPSTPQPQKRIFSHLRRSTFKLPRTATTPLILIAAGTGLAPLRAFLHERRQLLKIGRDVGDMLLFFGCRRPDEDFIYRDELAEMENAFGKQLKIVTAFSRLDTDGGGKRGYVQERVVEFKEEVRELLVERTGNLYICGRAGMAREVEKRVTGFLAEGENGNGMGSVKAAEEWVRGVKRRGKWQEDVWG